MASFSHVVSMAEMKRIATDESIAHMIVEDLSVGFWMGFDTLLDSDSDAKKKPSLLMKEEATEDVATEDLMIEAAMVNFAKRGSPKGWDSGDMEVGKTGDVDGPTALVNGMGSVEDHFDELFDVFARSAEDHEKSESLIVEQALSLKEQGRLKHKKVRGDGNCLFRAIGEYTLGEECFKEVREDVVSEVTVSPGRYVDFLGGMQSLKAWVQNMGKDQCWGDGHACRAASNEYSRPVVIFHKGSAQRPLAFLPIARGMEMNGPIYLEIDETGGEGTQHYSPLILVSPSDSENAVAEKRNAADASDVEKKRWADAVKSKCAVCTTPPTGEKSSAETDKLVTPPKIRLKTKTHPDNTTYNDLVIEAKPRRLPTFLGEAEVWSPGGSH